MKKLALSLVMTMLLFAAAPVFAGQAQSPNSQNGYTMEIDGVIMTEEPLVRNGTIYVPIRAVMEHMGARVSYNGSFIAIARGKTRVRMEVNSNTLSINGVSVPAASPPVIVGNLTYVPLRLIGNAFGYDVLYQDSSKKVFLRSPKDEAVVYGYLEDIDGKGVDTAVILLEDISLGTTVVSQVRNGFFRAEVKPNEYRFIGYQEQGSLIEQVSHKEPFHLSTGQTAFFLLEPSQAGLKVTLMDSGGIPLPRAQIAFNTSHGAQTVNIRNGVGYLDFYEKGSYLFNQLIVEQGIYKDYDVFHPFTVNEDGTVSSLDLIAHPPNIAGQVEGEMDSSFGNLELCTEVEEEMCFIEIAAGGTYAFYLPDGEYEWRSYYDSSNRAHHAVNLSIRVQDGKSDSPLQWVKPGVNIRGTARGVKGEMLSGGYIRFYGNGEEYAAWVKDGRFECYVPDGFYSVAYEQGVEGGVMSLRLVESIRVKGGKLERSTDFIFTESYFFRTQS